MSIRHNPKPSTAPLPVLKNTALAPIVYFDTAPACGCLNGNIEIELAARVLVPNPSGGISSDMVCVAHLRCSQESAMMLMDMINKALDIHLKNVAVRDAEMRKETDAEPPRSPLLNS